MANNANLKKYVAERNLMNQMWGKGAEIRIEFLTRGAKQELLDTLECDLSPENLCCDGEAPAAYVRNRVKMLRAAKAELNAMIAV